jgi:hypothetical protein
MKLPDLLKKAVQTEDWALICKAYTAITGEVLSPPPKKEVIDFASLEIPDELVGEFDDDDDDDDEDEEDAPAAVTVPSTIIIPGQEAEEDEEEEAPAPTRKKKDNDFIAPARKASARNQNESGKFETRREEMRIPKKGARPNKFEDDINKEEDKKLLKKFNPQLEVLYGPGANRKPRSESEGGVDTSGLVQVECSLCHNPGEVSPALARGYSEDSNNNTYRCNNCSTGKGRAKAMKRLRQEELNI